MTAPLLVITMTQPFRMGARVAVAMQVIGRRRRLSEMYFGDHDRPSSAGFHHGTGYQFTHLRSMAFIAGVRRVRAQASAAILIASACVGYG